MYNLLKKDFISFQIIRFSTHRYTHFKWINRCSCVAKSSSYSPTSTSELVFLVMGTYHLFFFMLLDLPFQINVYICPHFSVFDRFQKRNTSWECLLKFGKIALGKNTLERTVFFLYCIIMVTQILKLQLFTIAIWNISLRILFQALTLEYSI